MAAKDLNTPFRKKAPRRPRGTPFMASVPIALAVSLAAVAAVWIAVVDDPDGGQPVAVAMIDDAPAVTGSISQEPELEGAMASPAPSVAAALPVQVATLPALPSSGTAVPGLLEQSASGPLPKVAPDGTRPRDAYSRRPSAGDDLPQIALVIGGMGISQTGTQNAIEVLPEDITLAFAPYGASLQRWVEKARGEGHEIILQIPLEPIGYPDENPGEHTLLVSSDRQGAQQDLHWVLSRMTSYAGVMNYMGARFTSEDRALMPLIGEIGERGLYYLDDASSPDSRAAAVGEALAVPVVTADLVIDRDRSPTAIEDQLAALESLARSRGLAVGVGSAFPDTIGTVAAWARSARERGVALVPASAAALR